MNKHDDSSKWKGRQCMPWQGFRSLWIDETQLIVSDVISMTNILQCKLMFFFCFFHIFYHNQHQGVKVQFDCQIWKSSLELTLICVYCCSCILLQKLCAVLFCFYGIINIFPLSSYFMLCWQFNCFEIAYFQKDFTAI